QMIVFRSVCLKAQHQVTHTVPCGQLPEDHAQHLVPTGKTPYVFISAVFLYNTVEDPARQELGKLGEHIFTLVHGFLLQNPTSDSNRHAMKNARKYDIQRVSKNVF